MKVKLSEIPTLPSDYFLVEYSAQRTSVLFWARIRDGILDTGYMDQWLPIGKTEEKRICGKADVAILFEAPNGDKTWFHLQYDE